MNGDVEGVASRPHPLSGGLWTLFSWLRRNDHTSSNESISSVGSDRTAASFAFLAPAHYNVNNSPVFLPPPSSPTDSYRKRVQERNLRRHHERDLTLHRKYGLYRSDISNGYDAFSLPPTRKVEGEISGKWQRERRATSECFQRRALHVPGKRRAPLPPVCASNSSPVTHYRGPRKRPAPQPPTKLIQENKEIKLEANKTFLHMNPQTACNGKSLQNSTTMATDTSQKSLKKGNSSKETKKRQEKSFLKNIFENRKRNSVIDTPAIKILPSISELDKEAAAIIENVKLEALKENSKTDNKQCDQKNLESSIKKPKSDSWFCIKCLRKYDSIILDCPYCIFAKKQTPINSLKTNTPNDATNAPSNNAIKESDVMSEVLSNNYKSEEKQKLKEMLKEMKDSLPKRPKHENFENNITPTVSTVVEKDNVSETPTLRIGASVSYNDKASVFTKPSSSGLDKNLITSKYVTSLESYKNVTISTPVVCHHDPKQNNPVNHSVQNLKHKDSTQNTSANNISKINQMEENTIFKNPPNLETKQKLEHRLVGASSSNKILHTPLRISSLLNPVYVPKNMESKNNLIKTELKASFNTVNKIVDKSHNAVNNNTETASTSVSSQSYSSNANIDAATNTKENPCINKITTLPVLSGEAMTEINLKNSAKIQNNISNKSAAHPSTSTDISANDCKIKAVDMVGLSQHIKRRDLINQLEKSIANGDEHAAAEAAIKLAQLRLSCSVLSFSSQIISEPSTLSVSQQTNTSGLVKNVTTKNSSHKAKTDNVIVNTVEPGLSSESNTVIAPISSSSHEKSQRSIFGRSDEIKFNHSSQNDKSVQPSVTNASEKTNPSVKIPVNSVPIEDSTVKVKENTEVSISVWVEDKDATRGPIKLTIHRQALVGDLRRQAEFALGLPSHLQRWIVGRTLCTDDNTSLVTLAGSEFNAPVYLCLVETDPNVASTSRSAEKQTADVSNTNNETDNNVYKELVKLEQQALVPNGEVFECGVCIEECQPGVGVILRECVHMFCKDCLADVVRHSEEPDILCPAMGCRGVLQEREIRGLVSPEDYERWLARGLTAAESGTRNAFHCRTRDCNGWALCDPGVQRFLCPVCKHSNCVPCQAIHEGETCEEHRVKLQAVSTLKSSKSDDSTRALINDLINKGEALECPECKAIITKKWGCDWIKCSACKTEICWVTRGRRWGPGGRGDTSAGCRCGVDGKRCHPSCGYCH